MIISHIEATVWGEARLDRGAVALVLLRLHPGELRCLLLVVLLRELSAVLLLAIVGHRLLVHVQICSLLSIPATARRVDQFVRRLLHFEFIKIV